MIRSDTPLAEAVKVALDFVQFDNALESCGRAADRPRHRAQRRPAPELDHRITGEGLLPRTQRALVKRARCCGGGDSFAALWRRSDARVTGLGDSGGQGLAPAPICLALFNGVQARLPAGGSSRHQQYRHQHQPGSGKQVLN